MLDCISSFFVFSKQICFLNASRCSKLADIFLSNEEFSFQNR